MKKIVLRLVLIGLVFSCAEKGSKEVYQGKLEELFVGDFSLEKDASTRYISNIQVIKDGTEELISFAKRANRKKDLVFALISSTTGKEVYQIVIPTEGPESMKGWVRSTIVASKNRVFQINHDGEIGEYNAEGKQTSLYEFLNEGTITSFQSIQYRKPFIQINNDPSEFLNPNENVAAGELMSEFPLDFKQWLTHVNLETGQVENSDFLMPNGYELFKNDKTATALFGTYDSKRKLYYLAWPYSDEVYVLDGLILKQAIKPFSSTEYTYLPTEREAAGNYTIFLQPKNASKHLFLLYDDQRDLILRCSKINESGEGEKSFERTKHYALSIYSGDWQPKGEYFFDFENEIGLQNWFLTSEGLFINKPEQSSEDEYGFYKIDLTQFED